MAISFVEQANYDSGANPAVFAFTASGTADLLVGIIRVNAIGRTISIADSSLNSWTLGPQTQVGAGDVYYTFYCINPAGLGGTLTVTITASGGAVFTRALCNSYAGLATSTPKDKDSTNTGSGTTLAATSVTTAVANEVIVNLVGGPTSKIFTPDGTFTDRGTVPIGNTAADMEIADRIVSATGAFAPVTTVSASGDWVDFLLTFADTPVTGGATPLDDSGLGFAQIVTTRQVTP